MQSTSIYTLFLVSKSQAYITSSMKYFQGKGWGAKGDWGSGLKWWLLMLQVLIIFHSLMYSSTLNVSDTLVATAFVQLRISAHWQRQTRHCQLVLAWLTFW